MRKASGRWLQALYEDGLVPYGRGLPLDAWETEANCGPSALAAYLDISTRDAICLLPRWQEKRLTTSKQALLALERIGKPHQRVRLEERVRSPLAAVHEHPSGLAEVSFTRADGKTFSVTHMVAYDKDLIYDCNAQIDDLTGSWVPEEFWLGHMLSWYDRGVRTPYRAVDRYVRCLLVPRP
jgi:hypothetical protein